MRAFISFDKGLGTTAIYATVTSGDDFYDFTAQTFGALNADCKVWLEEQISAADDTVALYLTDITVPSGGPYTLKYYSDLTGYVIGYDLVWGEAETTGGGSGSSVAGITVGETIKAAYLDLGACDIVDGPTPEQYAQGMQALNSMLKSWGVALTIYGTVAESFTLTAGQAAYTVGSGGDFDTSWAYSVESAFIRDTNGFDYPVQIITQGQYDQISSKTVSSRPVCLLYNPKGYPTGTATLYFIPDKAYSLHWQARKVLAGYDALENSLGIAPEYEEAAEYNLAIRLAPKVGATVTPELVALARASKSAIPFVLEPAKFDGAFASHGAYSVYSDC